MNQIMIKVVFKDKTFNIYETEEQTKNLTNVLYKEMILKKRC